MYGVFEAARLLVKITIEPQSLFSTVSLSKNAYSVQSVPARVKADPKVEVVLEDSNSSKLEFNKKANDTDWRSQSRSASVCSSHSSFFSLDEQEKLGDKNLQSITPKFS